MPPWYHPLCHLPLVSCSRDDVIGKVCITRTMLAEHPKGRGQRGVPSAAPSRVPMTPARGAHCSHRLQRLGEPQRGGPR